MKAFQIMKNEVLIINEDKQYIETKDNFKIDGGSLKVTLKKTTIVDDESKIEYIDVTPSTLIYDDNQGHCVVDGEWIDYPQDNLDAIIADIEKYISAKAQREFIPPTFEEIKERTLTYQYQKYQEMKFAIAWLEDGSGFGFGTDPEDQNNWMASLTIMKLRGASTTLFKVFIDKNDLDKKPFTTVTLKQMEEAGLVAEVQQKQAYAGFEKVKEEINNCSSLEELAPYLPPEMA